MASNSGQQGGDTYSKFNLLIIVCTFHIFQVFYSIRIIRDDVSALHQPHLNISHNGTISNKPSVWRVTLLCSGVKTIKVSVTIGIHVRTENGELDRSFEIIRQKMCVVDNSSGVNKKATPSSKRTEPHLIFAGILLGALVLILFMVISVLSFHLRQRKKLTSGISSDFGGQRKGSSFNLNHFQYPSRDGQQQCHDPPGHLPPNSQHNNPSNSM